MKQQKSERSKLYISLCIFFSTLIIIILLIQPVNSYLDIKQYCRAFDENFQPIICLLKNVTKNPHPPANYNPSMPHPTSTQFPILMPFPPDEVEYDEDSDCSCEITCVPRIFNSMRSLQRVKRTTTGYRCRSCGTECSVSTTKPPSCYCVIPASKAECVCNATCAEFRYLRPRPFYQNYDDDESNCIFSVSQLEDWRLGEERPPYVCECKRAKEAENTSRPDFICICQRIPISRRH